MVQLLLFTAYKLCHGLKSFLHTFHYKRIYPYFLLEVFLCRSLICLVFILAYGVKNRLIYALFKQPHNDHNINETGVHLTAQKPRKRQGWWRGKFALFWRLATGDGGAGRADSCLEVDLHPRSPQPGVQGFYRLRGGLHAEVESALTVVTEPLIASLPSTVLVVFRTAGLQGHGPLVPVSLRPVLRVAAACPGCSLVTVSLASSTRCFRVCRVLNANCRP